MMKTLISAFALALAAPAALLAQSTTAEDAEAFVQTQANQVIETLTELQSGQTDLASVRQDFRNRIDELADVDRISNFVLGRYRRTASEDELAAFRTAFRNYAIGVYESELSAYAGQQLDVTGSVTRNPGDYIVRSRVYGGPEGEEFEVNWRILDTNGDLKAVDVEVLGVWLAQTQREQILSVIGDNGGNVSAATEMLRNREPGQDS
ncbi:phospholipid-binding protein MlaC [Oceanicaulis sp. LC35]|uniref:MlaC/ttg2D family ABC transporter substrate-binding protein n=1 Tax=Oceanicaulis sp. LC35 TaxID=3349635 RepID=UPI003F87301E